MLMSAKPMLHIAVALPCEAKPLIAHFHLKKILSTPFSIFANNEKSIYLIISGVGKIKMASATTYLTALTGNNHLNCFLNVGIAGSTQFPIKHVVLTNKITEYSTQRNWYPFVPVLKDISQSQLITHDLPQRDYPINAMVDMEGSAFFQAANLFVNQEHIQLVKIISDNNTSSHEKINDAEVQNLIADNISSIEKITNYLINLSQNEITSEFNSKMLSHFQEKWHFTCSQIIQLKEYLRRWNVKLKNQDPFKFCQNEKNSKNVIHKIIAKLEEHANCIH